MGRKINEVKPPELTQILDFAEKCIKIVVTTVFLKFKKLSRYNKRYKLNLYTDNYNQSKNTLDRINNRLDIAKEKISEVESIAIETI